MAMWYHQLLIGQVTISTGWIIQLFIVYLDTVVINKEKLEKNTVTEFLAGFHHYLLCMPHPTPEQWRKKIQLLSQDVQEIVLSQKVPAHQKTLYITDVQQGNFTCTPK